MKSTAPLIKRQTITSSVTDLIRSRIISNTYPGGYQIRQEIIASELGVSRIPVREALVQLEGEGLVVIHTHKGAIVSLLTIIDAVDIFDARALLEPFLITKAIENATSADIMHVRQAFDSYHEELKNEASPSRLSALNWSFHMALMRPSERPKSLHVLQSLYHCADRYLRLQINKPSAQTKALADHQALTNAFGAGEAVLAARLLKKHITSACEDVIKNLQSRKALSC